MDIQRMHHPEVRCKHCLNKTIWSFLVTMPEWQWDRKTRGTAPAQFVIFFCAICDQEDTRTAA